MTDNVVTRAAKLIDPGAFEDWFQASVDTKLETTRQAYLRAHALRVASDVLRLAARTPDLARVLADIEKDDWEALGVPVRQHPELEQAVDGKYA